MNKFYKGNVGNSKLFALLDKVVYFIVIWNEQEQSLT